MNKLSNAVLDKISENNNDYRLELRSSYNLIEEKITALVGDIVTQSNYVVDFSNTINMGKEKLSNPIGKIVESYVIKDLRGVETVNEQFVEKINDKMSSTNISSESDKNSFIDSLNTLLNEKYLEIVKIKRNEFLTNGRNEDVEYKFNDFKEYIKQYPNVNYDLINSIIDNYKNEIYLILGNALNNISNLYLNNFVSGIKEALSSTLKEEVTVNEQSNNADSFIPNIPNIPSIEIPEIPVIPEAPVIPEVPSIPEVPTFNNEPMVDNSNETLLETESNFDIPQIPEVPSFDNFKATSIESMVTPTIEPIEAPKTEKKQYDVEEILKIAKSPVLAMGSNEEKEKTVEFNNVEPIPSYNESDTLVPEFNEEEIVKELIKRLSVRLNNINEKQNVLDKEEQQLNDDENFVNGLIENANNKLHELDEFEEELNKKEEELKVKREELNKKINDVLPFANAVMNVEKES